MGRRLYIIESSKFANPAYQAEPVEWLKRLDKTNWESKHPDYVNYTNLANDAAAAYQLALRWKLSDEAEYGDAAKTILNAWAKNCKGIYRENGSLIDPNELLIAIQAYQLANAAEILRGYDNWGIRKSLRLLSSGWRIHSTLWRMIFLSVTTIQPTTIGSIGTWRR